MKPNVDAEQQLSGPTNALATRRLEPARDQPLRSVQNTGNGESRAVPNSSHALFVIPRGGGDGFRASIRGHILDLAEAVSAALAAAFASSRARPRGESSRR